MAEAATTRSRGVLTRRGWSFLLLGLLLPVIGYLAGWRDLLRVGLLLLALALLVLALYPRRRLGLVVSRTPEPPRLAFGERGVVQVIFDHQGRRSTPLLLVQEQLAHALGTRPRFAVPGMPVGGRRSISYPVVGHLRGRHRVGPLVVEQRDPFGLTRLSHQISGATELVVLPRIVDLADGCPRAGGLGTEGDVPLMLALRGEDDVSIRAYHEGDDLRRVHWPATAHRDELMMRQEERPAQRRAVLFLDARETLHRGRGASSSLEWAITAIASAAVLLDRAEHQLYLVSPGTASDARCLSPLPLAEILLALATEQPSSDAAHQAARLVAGQLVRDTGLVLVASAAGADFAAEAEALHPRQGCGLALLLEPSTFERAVPSAGQIPPPEPAPLAGWRAVHVHGGTDHRAAWEALAASNSTLRAGR